MFQHGSSGFSQWHLHIYSFGKSPVKSKANAISSLFKGMIGIMKDKSLKIICMVQNRILITEMTAGVCKEIKHALLLLIQILIYLLKKLQPAGRYITHHDIFWLQAKEFKCLLKSAACLFEKQQIPLNVFFCFDTLGTKSTTWHTSHDDHTTTVTDE